MTAKPKSRPGTMPPGDRSLDRLIFRGELIDIVGVSYFRPERGNFYMDRADSHGGHAVRAAGKGIPYVRRDGRGWR